MPRRFGFRMASHVRNPSAKPLSCGHFETRGNFVRFKLLLAPLLALWWSTDAGADAGAPKVRLDTSLGTIVLQLDRERAPQTVANFLQYVTDGFYDATIFHRVIEGFMIQGGGLDQAMGKKANRSPVENEADNGLKNVSGTIAMARTSDPHSATSQFFINVADNQSLDHTAKTPQGWGYAVFGRVVEGMETVDRIRETPTVRKAGRSDVPNVDVIIESATIVSESSS